MSTVATPPIRGDYALAAPPIIQSSVTQPSALGRALIAPVKFLWGMALMQSFLGSLMVVGWTYRLAQRCMLKFWWARSSHMANGGCFAEFLAAHPGTHDQLHWPNWFAQQNFRQAIRRNEQTSFFAYVKQLTKACCRSLGRNLTLGAQAIANTWVLTMPACALWLFAWYDGWNNSFNKGYEQAAVGPLLGVFGVMLFIAVMFFVPMAQMRHAATGQWRAFYQFGLVWGLVRRRWLACMLLAVLYALLSVPVTVLKTAPYFLYDRFAAKHGYAASLANPDPQQLIQFLNGYYFWSALLVFPVFAFLRFIAARIYASALLDSVQTGQLPITSLAASERDVLERLELLHLRPQPQRHFFVRAVAWFATRTGRVAGTILLIGVWFAFVAQIFIGQFLNFHPLGGWLNQPLVQLPWFHYLPPALKNSAGEILFTAFLFLAFFLGRRIVDLIRSWVLR
ncbi:MAG: DUF4013 domain-containing protein [Verrucomicrobia bacterium]|nr:DUF4013 domain-containing protein [Verrucomicrobiota bacterium]